MHTNNEDGSFSKVESKPSASRAVIVKKLEFSCTEPLNIWGGIDLMPQLLRAMEIEDPQFYARMQAFFSTLNLDSILSGRCSSQILLDLFFGPEFLGLNPCRVVDEIKSLEKRGISHTKPATPFSGRHLGGLWHKHYMNGDLASLAHNLGRELKRKGDRLSPFFEERIKEAQAAGEERFVTGEDVPKIAKDIVASNLARRRHEGRMTGEWIIYVEHESHNFYLCLAKHNDGDEKIRNKIDHICVREFPFLKDVFQEPPPKGKVA